MNEQQSDFRDRYLAGWDARMKRHWMDGEERGDREHRFGVGMGLGAGFGLAVGAGLGAAIGTLSTGIGLGLAMGVCLGIAIGSVGKRAHGPHG